MLVVEKVAPAETRRRLMTEIRFKRYISQNMRFPAVVIIKLANVYNEFYIHRHPQILHYHLFAEMSFELQ